MLDANRLRERRAERDLIDEYRGRVEAVLDCLNPEVHATAVDIAAVPETIRGFGHVRQGNLAAAGASWADLDRELQDPGLRGAEVVKFVEPVAA